MPQPDTTSGVTKHERISAVGSSKNIRLRDFRAEDAGALNQWLRDPGSTISVLDSSSLPSVEDAAAFSTAYSQLDNEYIFVAELRKKQTPVGLI